MESIEEHKISAQDEQNEDECYASTEEYFLDCCRYGYVKS